MKHQDWRRISRDHLAQTVHLKREDPEAPLVHSQARMPALLPPQGPASTLKGSGSREAPQGPCSSGPEDQSLLPFISFADEILHFCPARVASATTHMPAFHKGPGWLWALCLAWHRCQLSKAAYMLPCSDHKHADRATFRLLCRPHSPFLHPLSSTISPQRPRPFPTQPLKPLQPPQAKMISPTS